MMVLVMRCSSFDPKSKTFHAGSQTDAMRRMLPPQPGISLISKRPVYHWVVRIAMEDVPLLHVSATSSVTALKPVFVRIQLQSPMMTSATVQTAEFPLGSLSSLEGGLVFSGSCCFSDNPFP